MVCASTGSCPPGQRRSVLMWTLPVSLTADDPGGMTTVGADSITVAETNGDVKENHRAASPEGLLHWSSDGRTQHQQLSQSPSLTGERRLRVSHTAALLLFIPSPNTPLPSPFPKLLLRGSQLSNVLVLIYRAATSCSLMDGCE